ncbi:MAG: M48 family metalloprotease [Kofleriaceae bacterium]|nr:M48 family metalloprotease [Kofleriaceae bacterium]MBP9167274.1 M48 family metalloprotease [Kofleriaceae bacterium]MBP9860759.1 M48 family metalloprotease [Kofleriaceae bacterium]
MTRPALAAALAAAVALAGCKLSLTPEGLAKTWDAITDAQKELTPENEYWTGRSVATNLLARHDYQYADAEALQAGRLEGVTAYVSAVGGVIAASAMETRRDGDRPAPIGGWHFTIVESDAINAFAAPGGWVFVTTAAVQAARSEDELAALLAHEVAHVVRGHALGSIKKGRWANVAKTALDTSVTLDQQALGELTQVFEGAMDDMIDNTLVKGYSRDTEFEADKVAMAILAHAGYDPQALVRYLGTLEEHHGGGGGGWSATHPKPSDRIAKVSAQAQTLGARAVPKVRIKRFEVAIEKL